ncbi:MAG: outer membrane protein transport protein [Bacteroidota bacterium]
MKRILFTALALLPWLFAEAGGFQVVLQGVRQTSMGNTAVGQAADASSVFFNPGAMAMLGDNVVAAGGSFISSNIAYSGAFGSAESDNPLSTPFYFYAVYGVGADGAEGTGKKLKLGLGVFTPYGSTTEWPDQWVGQAYLRSLSLRSIYVQPTVAYQITDKLGFGAGLDIVFGGVSIVRAIPTTNIDGENAEIEFEGDAEVAVGFNLGLYYKPIDQLSIGLNYRSEVETNVEGGDVTYTGLSSTVAASGQFPANNRFDASLPLPAVLTFGVGVYPTEGLTLAADLRYTFWSAYEELRFDFEQPIAGSNENVSARNYEDSFTLSVGAEYAATDALMVRAGGYYDWTPIPDGYMTPETPDANTVGLTLGLGYTFAEKLVVDAGVLFVIREERENDAAPDANTLSGTYETRAVVPSIGVAYLF